MKLTSNYKRSRLRLITAAPMRAQSRSARRHLPPSPRCSTTDARLHGGEPTVSESIWTGSVDYVMVKGKCGDNSVAIFNPPNQTADPRSIMIVQRKGHPTEIMMSKKLQQ